MNKVEIQLEAISDSLEKLEKKPAKDHSQELESIRSEISRFKSLLSGIQIDVPKTDLSPLNAKLEAIDERLTTIDERTKYIRWLFPDLRAFFTSIGTWLFLVGMSLIIGLSFVLWHYYKLSERYEPSFYQMELARRAPNLYTINDADSLWQHHRTEIIGKIDSARQAEKEIVQRKKEALEKELEED